MANRRMINKSDLERPGWTKLNSLQRYFYWGMTLITDDDGIVPMFIVRKELCDVCELSEDDLNALQDQKYIHCYESEGYRYVQMLFWWDNEFIDTKIYKPTVHPNSEYYLSRPKDLTKTRARPSFYDSSGKPLEQINIAKANLGKSSESETSLSEDKIDKETGEVSVPWKEDGTLNNDYK